MILDAGYDQIHNVIASAVIQRLEHSREGTEVITDLELRDGGLGLDYGEFRSNYPAGTSKLKIVNDILGTMTDVTKGPITAVGLSGTIPYKMTFSGKSRAALEKLARSWAFEWSVQDGSVQVLDRKKGTIPQTLAVVASADTGLLGSPTRTDKGAKFKTLLMGHINPGTLIDLKSEFYSSVLKALTVTHTGDTHGSEWSTEVEAKDLLEPPIKRMK